MNLDYPHLVVERSGFYYYQMPNGRFRQASRAEYIEYMARQQRAEREARRVYEFGELPPDWAGWVET